MAYRIDPATGDIIIDGWESGISDSPYGTNLQTQVGNIQQTGLADMRNVNVISIPGEASVLNQTVQASQTPVSGVAYTAVAATDIFTYTGTTVKAGTAIVITVSTGTGGITSGNTYWVRDVSGNTFKVGSGVDAAGTVTAAINVTSDGTGTFTTVNMSSLVQIVNNDHSAQALTGIANYFSPVDNQGTYAIDSNGLAWIFVPGTPNWVYAGNTTINSSPPRANGIAVWKGYILVFRSEGSGGQIDYRQIGGTSSLSAWTYGWKTGLTSLSMRTFTDTNDVLYFCNGAMIGILIQLTTFDPANPATYSYTPTALLLNPNDAANCMAQLGNNLVVGASSNIMYIWNADPLNAGNYSGYTPVLLPEATIARIVTVNSNSYVFAGNRGRIYITNGANVSLYKKVPDHLAGGAIEPYYVWGGATYSRNQLYFSASAFSGATGVAIPNYGGIWAISTDTNAVRLTNILSYGTYAGYCSELAQFFTNSSSANVSFGQTSIIAGWYNGISLYGADYIPTSPTPYSNSQSYVDSDMIPIGTLLNPETDSNVEYKLTVPMVAGESVTMQYRQNFAQSFTTITDTTHPTGVFTVSDNQGFSGVIQVNFQKSQWIQIRTLLSSTATNPSYVRLREMRIRK